MASFSKGRAAGGGAPGPAGADGDFIYVGYATASDGTGYDALPGPTRTYFALKRSATEIVSPVAADFAGLWQKYIGADGINGTNGTNGTNRTNGTNGVSSYTYIAYASDASGTGFTQTFSTALDYIAIKTSATPLTPVVGDFAGIWFKYKGEPGISNSKSDLDYVFSSGTADNDPTTGRFKFNSATIGSINRLWQDDLDVNSNDMQSFIQNVRAGDKFLVLSADGLTTHVTVTITLAAVDKNNYWEYQCTAEGASLPANLASVVLLHVSKFQNKSILTSDDYVRNHSSGLIDKDGNVLSGTASVANYSALPAAASNTGVIYRINDLGLEYVSDGTYWIPQNKSCLYGKSTGLIAVTVPAATFTGVTATNL